MFEIRIHGRGGQGVVTAAELLSAAAFAEGKHAQAFPRFGSERTGAPVEKREIPMYYLNITRYADELLEALAEIGGWPERVRVMQANWIGRSEGCEIAFP